MGQIARPLERKHKPFRNRVAPLLERLRRLHPIKGAIDLERIEMNRGKGQFALLRQPLGIEIAAPGRVGPPRKPDPDLAPLHQPLPRSHLLASQRQHANGRCRALSAPSPLRGFDASRRVERASGAVKAKKAMRAMLEWPGRGGSGPSTQWISAGPCRPFTSTETHP